MNMIKVVLTQSNIYFTTLNFLASFNELYLYLTNANIYLIELIQPLSCSLEFPLFNESKCTVIFRIIYITLIKQIKLKFNLICVRNITPSPWPELRWVIRPAETSWFFFFIDIFFLQKKNSFHIDQLKNQRTLSKCLPTRGICWRRLITKWMCKLSPHQDLLSWTQRDIIQCSSSQRWWQ
jgi:hypothetical protein